jgi:hypothetical protein
MNRNAMLEVFGWDGQPIATANTTSRFQLRHYTEEFWNRPDVARLNTHLYSPLTGEHLSTEVRMKNQHRRPAGSQRSLFKTEMDGAE